MPIIKIPPFSRLSRSLLFLLIALILTFTASPPLHAAPDDQAQIIIYPKQVIAPVTPMQLGSNLPMYIGAGMQNPTLLARTRALGLQSLRIPGGSDSDRYGWLSCEMRSDQPNAAPCLKELDLPAARPTDFINFIRATHIPNVIYTINLNVTPQEAAAAVAFFNTQPSDPTLIGVDANGFDWKTAGTWAQLRVAHGNPKPLNIKYWELGNEDYGGSNFYGGADCPTHGWEYTWTCDGTKYVNGAGGHAGYAAFRSAMQAIDPAIQVGAVGYHTPDGYNNWTNKVVTAAGSFMDFFVVHPYLYKTPPPNTFAGWAEIMAQPRQTIPAIKNDLQSVFDAHAAGRLIPLYAEEFNLHDPFGPDQIQMVLRAGNAFFITEMMGQFIANGFTGINQWDLTDGCPDQITCYELLQLHHQWKRSPQYYALALWSRFGSTMLNVNTNRDPATELSVYAGKIDNNIYSLLVLNKTSKPAKTNLTFSNHLRVTGGTADILSTRSPQSNKVKWNGKTNPSDDLSNAPPTPLSQVGTTTPYIFAPYSITLLHLKVQ